MLVPRIAMDGHAQGLGGQRESSVASTYSDLPGGISPRPDRARSESRSTDVGYGGYEEGHDRGQLHRGRSVSPADTFLFNDEGAPQQLQQLRGVSPPTAFARTAGKTTSLPLHSPERGTSAAPPSSQVEYHQVGDDRVAPRSQFRGFHYLGGFRTGQRVEDLGYDLRTLGDNNPGLDITAATVSHDGAYVAYGDRKGYLYVMKNYHDDVGNGGGARSSSWDTPPTTTGALARRVGYCPVIDPLNSDEVRPKVNSIKFLNTMGSTPYMVTCNDKVPKLWKVVQSRYSPGTFSAIDNLLAGSKTVPSLTLANKGEAAGGGGSSSSGGPLVLVKEAARFAIDHEDNIKDVCTFPFDPNRIVTVDALQLRTWDVDHPRTSLELYSVKPPPGEELRESFCAASVHASQPHTVFATSTNGCVRLLDTRESLTWHGSRPQTLVNPDRAEDGEYSAVTCHLSGVAVSPSNGYYMVGRDVMSLTLWDLRKQTLQQGGGGAGLPVCRWPLHPELSSHYENLYNTNLLFEPFSVVFSQGQGGSGGAMVHTGGMDGRIISLDPVASSSSPNSNSMGGAGDAIPLGDTTKMFKTDTAVAQGRESSALPPVPFNPMEDSGLTGGGDGGGELADCSRRMTNLAVGGYGAGEVLVASNRSTLHVTSF